MEQGRVNADPYPPLDAYGLIGDLRSAALVSVQGSIDWLCLPRFDSPSVFGRVLDWGRGGCFAIAPSTAAAATHAYRTHSNVLETVWTVERSQARVVDFMPLAAAAGRQRPPAGLRLVRLIQPLRGSVRWTVRFMPRFDYGARAARIEGRGPGLLSASGPAARLWLRYPEHFDLQPTAEGATLTGTSAPGTRCAFLLFHIGDGGRPPAAVPLATVDRWLESTDGFWRDWLSACTYRGRFDEQVRRSALLLKLMQFAPTGAFVAAPTTSLPERIGGSLNWDYRFTWLRDMAVLVNALHQLGFVREADEFMGWLDRRCACDPRDFQMLYRVDGDPDVHEQSLDFLDGYRGSQPVRIGNAASTQRQLDVYGEVLETAFSAWSLGRRLPPRRRRFLNAVVDEVIANWEQEDSGIWESRRRKRRYLYSQAMCWLALDRALRMEPSLRMGARRRAAARRTRGRIKEEVLRRSYNQRLGAFTQAFDDETLDATGLTVPLTGMIPASDPRVVSTVEVLQRQLMRDGLVLRYEGPSSEFGQDEGAFLICSFWMVDVLAQMGRLREAEELFARVTETANDLGLFAEEFDPRSGTMLGNFPQALTHLSLIGAVLNLERGSAAKSRRRLGARSRTLPG